MSLVDAVSSGDRVESLVALRDENASAIDKGVPPRDLAALSKRLMDVVNQIDGLGGRRTDEDDTFDELRRRRAARRAAQGVAVDTDFLRWRQ